MVKVEGYPCKMSHAYVDLVLIQFRVPLPRSHSEKRCSIMFFRVMLRRERSLHVQWIVPNACY